jgi:S-adenosylmethionine-diacylglycerol 3-amino-3-carboxypropyl transferase
VDNINRIRDWVFSQVHTRNLVYNTCWEDPRCDRQLLELNNDSEIVMITSAGCNALDYLLDNPRRIHCIDVNPRQNALLRLKLSVFAHATHADLFALFGRGVHPDMEKLYRDALRAALPDYAQRYWDKNLNYFNGKGIRKTFYHYSTSGTVAWIANQYLRTRKKLYRQIKAMFEAENLERQVSIYYQIESKVLNPIVEWIVNRHLTMCLVGVPRSQQLLFRHQYDRGALGFIQECLRKVFTQLPLRDNYFWRLYLHGQYTEACCPAYLRPENFDPIAQRGRRIQNHNTTISDFLRHHPGAYSHFILLDHQDWLAANNRSALEEEWRLILENSRPGARILLRSAASEVDFFPDFVSRKVEFEKEQTAIVHQQDRVGTYASVYLGVVR